MFAIFDMTLPRINGEVVQLRKEEYPRKVIHAYLTEEGEKNRNILSIQNSILEL